MIMATTLTDFDTTTTTASPGYNPPQKMGRALWLPMFLMAMMAFPVAWILGAVLSGEIATERALTVDIVRLQHLVPAFGFIGFLGVFSAISFAISRILGAFRRGGGDVQETVGIEVETLTMPWTAKVFILSMAMGMMALVAGIVLHFVAAGAVDTDNLAQATGEWRDWIEAIRRIGIALHLFGIVFGLGTIIYVLRFQALRIREVAAQARGA
jgi:hypothetical protein